MKQSNNLSVPVTPGSWAVHQQHRYELVKTPNARGEVRPQYVHYVVTSASSTGRPMRMLYSAWKTIWKQASSRGEAPTK